MIRRRNENVVETVTSSPPDLVIVDLAAEVAELRDRASVAMADRAEAIEAIEREKCG
jgi:hypothetical protein